MAGASGTAVAPRIEAPEALFTKLSPGPGRSPDEVAEHQRARIYNAVLEIAAERGHDAAAVRDITRLAGVSSRSFYKHYATKDECFLRTHQAIARSVAQSIAAAQAEESDWRDRLHAVFVAFVGELQRDLRAARLLLIEAYAAGPESLDRAQRVERAFEALIADGLGDVERDIASRFPLARALTAGMISLTRSRLLSGREDDLSSLPDVLTRWALSLARESPSADVVELERPVLELQRTSIERQAPSSERDGEGARSLVGDRALILDAIAKLVPGDGYAGLTVASICFAAGVSRRRFHLQYEDIDACFADAAELHLSGAFATAQAALEQEERWDRALQGSLTLLCHMIATDAALQRLGFAEVLSPGHSGLAIYARTVGRIHDLIAAAVQGMSSEADAATEASAGAIWALLRQPAVEPGPWKPSRVGWILTFLALAPIAVSDPGIHTGNDARSELKP